MKQEERREQTTRQLLDATKALLQEKGCHAITMKDIVERSELSKGAIFHYVKSKDEIFAWVLQDRLEETNRNFLHEVERGPSFEGPMEVISRNLALLENTQDVTNKVLMYLLGKEDEPAVAEVLKQFYERSVSLSKSWIVSGQHHGVIPESVDPEHAAEMFVLLSLGLRVRSSFPVIPQSSKAADVSSFIVSILQRQ
ncbi:TetR/AcrR family transcriptional regulator [Paenibacillus thalictri]|uniref:TetR/AcrR family transcriptional regulator n=1 Tax=Paenibacillus thalictri TaxID=2527873 RepID=A0A4Q9DVK0_9BACL|nr:TetR/AcrR family transcriptional regulator [Paenibacillus thalictri]TBL81074.1 TetR/AcrR family transcriptional regulator [Paenibacillus thalictri]